jgi:hypothetical protein
VVFLAGERRLKAGGSQDWLLHNLQTIQPVLSTGFDPQVVDSWLKNRYLVPVADRDPTTN